MYYFPTCTSKRIPISEIRSIQLIEGVPERIWGTITFDYWFPLEKDRTHHECFIAVDNGSSLKPAFTCTDTRKVYGLLFSLLKKNKGGLKNLFKDGDIEL